ncbi:MAG: hypothetical protein INQ03_07880 [Candidatus Heimdallarchaeota archaeon]|nr:hypothetical protein [Candidatus Heimdallarchaeota archaeon]
MKQQLMVFLLVLFIPSSNVSATRLYYEGFEWRDTDVSKHGWYVTEGLSNLNQAIALDTDDPFEGNFSLAIDETSDHGFFNMFYGNIETMDWSDDLGFTFALKRTLVSNKVSQLRVNFIDGFRVLSIDYVNQNGNGFYGYFEPSKDIFDAHMPISEGWNFYNRTLIDDLNRVLDTPGCRYTKFTPKSLSLAIFYERSNSGIDFYDAISFYTGAKSSYTRTNAWTTEKRSTTSTTTTASLAEETTTTNVTGPPAPPIDISALPFSPVPLFVALVAIVIIRRKFTS